MKTKEYHSKKMTNPATDRSPIRVAVVSGHAFIADLARQTLANLPGIELTGSATTPSQAVELVQREDPAVLLLLDVGSTIDELDVIIRITALGRDTAILVIPHYPNFHVSARLMGAGARGILTRDVGLEEALEAIRIVHGGERYWTTEVLRTCAELHVAGSKRHAEEALTDREHQVAKLIAQGYKVKEIAARLGVSVKTVHTHFTNIKRKLQVRNEVELAHFMYIEKKLLAL
ncbi:MAG: DNA-binding response regulator [Acidobacteria bacterium]|nr:MAG: DNA-binding response regulator [Acidobacteriota bacterium]